MDFKESPDCRQLVELSHQFLHSMVYRVCKDHTIADEVIAPYLQPNHAGKKLKLNQLYEHFLLHAQNKSNGGNAIRAVFGRDWGNLLPHVALTDAELDDLKDQERAKREQEYKQNWKRLGQLLWNFDPKCVVQNVKDQAGLAERLAEFGPETTKKHPQDYLRTIWDITRFFAQKQFSEDGTAVYEYFDNYYDAQQPAKLVKWLKRWSGGRKDDFFGMGEALLPDALKELGYAGYVKPDVHIKYIAAEFGLIDSEDIATEVERVAHRAGITPYQLDKYWYLIGSGDFYYQKHKDYRDPLRRADSVARKEAFVAFVRERFSVWKLAAGLPVALLIDLPQEGLTRGQRGEIKVIRPQPIPQSKLVEVTFAGKPVTVYPTDFLVLHGEK